VPGFFSPLVPPTASSTSGDLRSMFIALAQGVLANCFAQEGVAVFRSLLPKAYLKDEIVNAEDVIAFVKQFGYEPTLSLLATVLQNQDIQYWLAHPVEFLSVFQQNAGWGTSAWPKLEGLSVEIAKAASHMLGVSIVLSQTDGDAILPHTVKFPVTGNDLAIKLREEIGTQNIQIILPKDALTAKLIGFEGRSDQLVVDRFVVGRVDTKAATAVLAEYQRTFEQMMISLRSAMKYDGLSDSELLQIFVSHLVEFGAGNPCVSAEPLPKTQSEYLTMLLTRSIAHAMARNISIPELESTKPTPAA
jgi:hypothetical protein